MDNTIAFAHRRTTTSPRNVTLQIVQSVVGHTKWTSPSEQELHKMAGQPFFSIVTICFNEVHRIEATMESVFSQSCQDLEYLIIDGGSTDGTKEAIEKFAARLAYHCSEPDNGIYAAMNKGGARAKGRYLLFLNSGDRLHDDKVLERVRSCTSDDDILFGYVSDTAGNQLKKHDSRNFNLARHLHRYTLPHQATFCKVALFHELGGFDEQYRLAADYELLLRALKQRATFHYINECIAFYDRSGISAQEPLRLAAEQRSIRCRHFRWLDRLSFRMLTLATHAQRALSSLMARFGSVLFRRS